MKSSATVWMMHVGPSHRVTEELCRSQESNLHVLPRWPVQAEAVRARVQLFHLYTQEPLMLSRLHAQQSPTHFTHRCCATQLLRGRCVNYSQPFHTARGNVAQLKELHVCFCMCVLCVLLSAVILGGVVCSHT